MENLLCEESWLSSSFSSESSRIFLHSSRDNSEAISVDLERELCYTPRDEYVELLMSRDLTDARYRAVQWLIESRCRLNLSFETVFSAVNSLDRFISVSSCNEWKYWMMELISIACLSTASKFNEISYPSLQEIQVEGLNHTFGNSTILRMELILLKALQWRITTITTYSFSLLILSEIGFTDHSLLYKITNLVTDHLLEDLSDFKMQEYPPSVVGLSTIWKVLEELSVISMDEINLKRIMNLFDEERKEKVSRCIAVRRSRQIERRRRRRACGHESPVTVLVRDEQQKIDNGVGSDISFVDFSMFQILQTHNGLKRKRERLCYEEKH